MLRDTVTNSSLVGLLGMMVSVGTLGMALRYAISPSERRLALLRPLSLAAIFGGLTSFTVGVISVLTGVSANISTGRLGPVSMGAVSAGMAESVVGLFFACGCLTIAWLLVAVGLWRAESSR
jgi:hypothetical protein